MMEKHYEKPEANVISYKSRVRTDSGDVFSTFTDSNGVECGSIKCGNCGQVFFTAPLDANVTEADITNAYKKHLEKCPNKPN